MCSSFSFLGAGLYICGKKQKMGVTVLIFEARRIESNEFLE